MAMIGPLPVSPAAPTPWSVDDVFPRRVNDAKGEPLFSVDGLALTHDQDAALARELVDLVNRATSSKPYEDIVHACVGGVMSAVFTEPPTVCLPATVETYDGVIWFEVNRQSPPGFTKIRVIDGFGETFCVFDPASARTLAYALLAAAGPEPVEGPTEPDPRDPSTWRRYVDEDGDEWFEISLGRAECGTREDVGSRVKSLIDAGENPTHYSAYLDDARESCGLRRA